MTKKFKLMASTLLMVAFAAMVCTSCSKDEPTPVQVSDITLNKTTLTLIVGASETLTATVMPDNAADKTITWTSSATAVATVDASTGEVTAVTLGAATITAAAGGKTATCEVTVTPPPDISIDVTPDGTNTFAFYATATRLTVDWGDGATEEFTNIDIHTDAVTHTYANNEKRLVTIIAEGLTEFGDDTTPLGSGSGGVTTNRSIAGSMEKINCSHCPDLKGIYILHNALTEADMSGAPQVENVFLVGNGNLAALNLTGCTALSYLWCSYTQLAALDVSDCTNLTRLDCAYNQLETLDVSGCPNLIEFYCINNQLTSLDVSNHTALTRLSCDENQLGSLNISGCTALVELNCGRNQLTSLDASTNTALTRLHCYVNQLGSLDVSGCTALVYLDCGINRLTGLDVSSNTAIKQLYCDENQFSATALNNVFTALPSRVPSDYARIYITENPGTSACNTSIATAKNWTVVNE